MRSRDQVRWRRYSQKAFFAVLSLLLAACATSGTQRPASGPDLNQTTDRIVEAAATPLTDLNLVRAEIPSVLVTAQKAPYALPVDRSCAALALEIQALDAVLGADLDTPPTESNPGLVERGAALASDAAVGAVRDAAQDVVPFRRWVRQLSGAERYAKDVAAAIDAGTIRRAFLKGLGQAGNCPVPAAPRG